MNIEPTPKPTYNAHEVAEHIKSSKTLDDINRIWGLVIEEKYRYTLIELWAFQWLCQQQTYTIREIDTADFKAFMKAILGIDLF